jgi:ligand-binding sensor domain-containing protein/signal transduction histidine kinase
MKNIFIAFLMLLVTPAFSQTKDLHFKKLSVENGLPENYATSVLQDRKGFIWFCTQNGLVRYDGYKVKVYNLETPDKKERSYRSVWFIIEDKNGAIWVASSYQGVFRYNWSTDDFTQYQHSDQDRRKSKIDLSRRLLEDKEGYIWSLCFDNSAKDMHLDRIDPGSGKFETYDSLSTGNYHLPSKMFHNSFFKDAANNIWISMKNGLYAFDYTSKKFIPFYTDNNDKASISNVYEAPSEPGILWLSILSNDKNSFVRFDIKTKSIKAYNNHAANPYSLHCDSVLTVFEDRNQRLWLGTTNGLSLFDRKKETFTAYLPKDQLSETFANYCWDIKEGQNGELWILTGTGLRGYGLFHLASLKSNLLRYKYDESKPNGLPSNTLNISFVDRNQNLWLGSRGNGFYLLDDKVSNFDVVKKEFDAGSYPGGPLISSKPYKENTYVIATGKGLYLFQSSTKKYTPVLFSTEKKVQESIRSMIIDKKGIVWIGTNDSGLFFYDLKTNSSGNFKFNPVDNFSLPHNLVRTLYQDKEENLWVGTYGGGLCRFDPVSRKFKRYAFTDNQDTLPNGVLDDDQVLSIMEDNKGVLWVGTNNGGLNKLDKSTGRFTSYFDNEKGFHCISPIYEDTKGRMWAGTYLWGLFLFDRATGKSKRFTEKDGLVYNQVNLIKEDAAGKIWVGAQRGFSILDPSDFSIKTLTTANGLPQNDLTSADVYDMNGRWMVGTKSGYFTFLPEAMERDASPPQVVLETVSFTKDGKSDSTLILNEQKKIEFAHFQNRLNFSFVGLHFTNPELNEYKYMLVGYDKEWIPGGNQRFATYTNLSPGPYTFLVKAASSDGVWTKEATGVEIIIHPPWWKTWWAYLFNAVIFAIVIWSYIRYRSAVLLMKNKILEEKVHHRTEQLQKSLGDLKFTQSQLIQSEKMASLGELTAGIAHEIQNPLNFVNNFSEVNLELIDEMKTELKQGNTSDALEITDMLGQNLEKIAYHGKRADSIVKSMLQHSSKSSGEKELVDINALVDEYLRLSYHGLRAKDKSFNAIMETHFDPAAGKINIAGQDIGRVLLNLFNNAFYAVNEKKKTAVDAYQPTVQVTTSRSASGIEIKIKDNGTGIPEKALEKIYQPFFTTKPTGEGTGLGLSLSYDIITKGHGGEMKVETEEGEGATFLISVPTNQ